MHEREKHTSGPEGRLILTMVVRAKQAAEKTSDLRLGFASSRFSGHCFATKAVFWPFFGARGREFLTEETPLLGAYAATGMSLLMRTKL
jgi:hypothetical protein